MSDGGEAIRRVRVVLPYHLRNLARVGSEVELEIAGAVTVRSVVDSVEARYPMLLGTIRDQGTKQRRPFLRFFACEEDCRMNRSMRRCRTPWRRGKNRC
jgi:hypothetical protein